MDNYNSYEKLLEKSMMPSLKTRRLRIITIETFKILHKHVYIGNLYNNNSINQKRITYRYLYL
jgi:hypothetical protein